MVWEMANTLPQASLSGCHPGPLLTYKDHIANTKAKVSSRNSILKKLANTKWGTDASTIRTTALALCFSAAEYASPVWSRSVHAAKIDPVLNDACRAITGCLKPTRVDDLYLLSGIAPPYIRRTVVSEKEKNKQETDPLHPLFQQEPAVKRLKSRKSFLHLVEPLQASPRRIQPEDSSLVCTPSECTEQE